MLPPLFIYSQCMYSCPRERAMSPNYGLRSEGEDYVFQA